MHGPPRSAAFSGMTVSRCLASFAWVVLAAVVTPPANAAESWPEFRGPWGNGHASAPGATADAHVPLLWSETDNVVWKTPLPHVGWSTPVVLDGKIWITTATEEGHDYYVLCVDASTGEMMINEKLFHTDTPEPLGNNMNSYASPTAVAEPGRVYVHFGSYGTACLDSESGKVLWQRTDLPCRHFRGPGSSPLLFEDLLILTFDGADLQYLAALNKQTGETVWRTDRSTEWLDLDDEGNIKREGDFRKAFTTPVVIDTGGGNRQLISPGSYAAFAYDPRTGNEIWKFHHTCYSPASRPVFDGERVYIPSGRGQPGLWAIRPDGHGDITDTHVVWKVEDAIVPLEPSPLLIDGLLYMVSGSGDVSCLEAATGNEVWSEHIGGNYMASPIFVAGRLYFFSIQGKSTVLKPGRAFEVLATNELESGFMASPAVVGNALYLRSKTHLYRIEEPAKGE